MEKIAFLFAGQGAQYVGMGKDLYEAFPESRTVFDKTQNILDFDLKRLCFQGPQELLKLTHISQPAIFTVSIATFEAFKARVNVRADFAAGLSLGEYTALVAAGSLSFEDGLKLVRKRGEIMSEAGRKHPGKMLAVLDLPFQKVREICLLTQAEMANINAPGQIVISGKSEAVDKAKDLLIQAGAKKVVELEVSAGFHSSLMLEASKELEAFLNNVSMSPPSIPIISNYTARPEDQVAKIKANLVSQMYSSVKWEDSMRFVLSQGITKFFEFGPGEVLKGLMRRIDANAQVINIEKKEDILNLVGGI